MSSAQTDPAILSKISRRIKIAKDKGHPKRKEAAASVGVLLKKAGLTLEQFKAQQADFKGAMGKAEEMLTQEGAMAKHFGSTPPATLVYGESKVGKSAEGIFTHPGALFLVGDGHLKACKNLIGWAPENYLYPPNGRQTTLATAYKALRGRVRREKHKAMVIEEMTMLAGNQVEAYREEGMTGWDPWVALKKLMIDIVLLSRERKAALYMTAHPKSTNEDKDFLVGAADIGSYSVSKETPRYLDLVLRAAYSEEEYMPQHPFSYHQGDPTWVTGDRHAVLPNGESPMNIAELYRKAGYVLHMPEDLRWIEEATAAGFDRMLEGSDLEEAAAKIWARYAEKKGKETPQVLWALRNLRDRWWFHNNSLNQQRLSQFGLGRSTL